MRDADNRKVELSARTWEVICANQPELREFQRDVVHAVTVPYRRSRSARFPQQSFCDKKTGPGRWLKVVVSYEGLTGMVIAVLASRDMP